MTVVSADATIEISDWDRLSPNPLVSIYMLTYAHQEFIGQAIEGVISQRCEFPIELIIGEDCSPDRTGDIARHYQQRYPELIRILTARINVGANRNAARCRRACRGKFIAICEGDDYWTAPDKLSKQVAILTEDENASIAYHDVAEVDQDGHPIGHSKIERLTGSKPAHLIPGKSLILSAFIPTVSAMYRNYQDFPPRMPFPIINGDNYLIAHLGTRGHARLVSGVMAAYRHHPGGIWSSRKSGSQRLEKVRSFLAVFETLDHPYRRVAAIALYNKLFSALLSFMIDPTNNKMPKGFPPLAVKSYLAPILYPFRAGLTYHSLTVSATALAYPFMKAVSKLFRDDSAG